MEIANKSLKIPTSTHTRISDLAWAMRTSKSALSTQLVTSVAEAMYDKRAEPDGIVNLKVNKVSRELWAQAVASAHEAGMSLAEAILVELDKMEASPSK